MKTLLLLFIVLSGCASPCMKKSTVLEQKQCKWVARQDRDVKLFMGSGMVAIVLTPFIAGHVFGKGDAPKWLAPALGLTWAVGMFAAIDGSEIQGPYPKKENAKGGK